MKNTVVSTARALSLCALAVLGAASPFAAQGADAAPRLCLRGPADTPVSFHGAVNYDGAGSGPGAMLYPAPGVAGLLAAIATHAVISNRVRDSEKQGLREQADKILLPYRSALNNYKHRDLMQASLVAMRSSGDKRFAAVGTPPIEGETVVDSQPAFFMTQDQRALILENAVTIQAAGVPKPYQKVVRVVSPAQDDGTDAQAWFGNNESLLRQVSARMVAQSIDIALEDMGSAAESAAPFRTVRYREGGVERIERAQVLREQCGNMVLRTLRADLMSVPRNAAPGEAGCDVAAP